MSGYAVLRIISPRRLQHIRDKDPVPRRWIVHQPMGVSAYKVTNSLPEELQRQLPSIEDIEKRIQKE